MSMTMRAIYGAAKQLGLDEDTRRALFERETGKRSLTAMTPGDQVRVLQALRRAGGTAATRLDGPYAGKLQALWISGWNLGVVQHREDTALLAFVEARTRIAHTRFLRDAADARKAVEALKSWLTREAGVDWSAFADPLDAVIAAQGKWLGLDAAPLAIPTDAQQGFNAWRMDDMQPGDRQGLTRLLGQMIRKGV